MTEDYRRPLLRDVIGEVFKYLVLFVVAIWVLLPVYWMVTTSFKTKLELSTVPPNLWPEKLTWTNYRNLFVGRPFDTYLLNSLIVVLSAAAAAIVIGTLAAYSLARLDLKAKFKSNIAFWILSTRMLPAIVVLVPIYAMYNALNLLNTRIGLILLYTGAALPFAVWMMQSFIEELPIDLEEAAWVDGDTRIGALFRIVMPLVAPGLVATSIFTIIVLWNEFLFALMLISTTSKVTLPVGINGLITMYDWQWGQMTAIGTIAVIPILIFTMYVQRYLVRGLTLGGVK
jgi:multiple sugar transport system permease protein